MKTTFVYYLLFAIYFLTSCSSEPEVETSDEKQAMISQIDSINKMMFDKKSMEFDKNLAFKGITVYQDFVKKYPDDTLSAEYLFRLSDLQRAVGDNSKAIESLSKICKEYPSYKKIPECLFLLGYYHQEFFMDTISAKGFYQQLISKYPTHAFADDAKALMSMFGKSEEDIIKSFELQEKVVSKK